MSKIFLIINLLIICYAGIFGYDNIPIKTNDNIKVFIDCQRCDRDYIRDQITFVNYVRDRNNSDVHILITRVRNGGGGREYTLNFIGRNSFSGVNDTLQYNIRDGETAAKSREILVKYLKLGLIRYASKSSVVEKLNINYHQDKNIKHVAVEDKWNNWVFRTRLRGYLNGEKSTNSLNLWGSFSINRITDDLKLKFSINGSYDQDKYSYDDQTYTSISRHQSVRAQIVLSHNQNWSFGVFNNVYSSIYDNIRFNASISPGIEYNIFPYSESTRKQLRINYIISSIYNNYDEETVYFESDELLVKQRFAIALDIVQPWGNIETELFASHYIHDISLHFLELRSEFRINVISGLTLDLYGRLAYIHDQISLPRSGVNLEEVLLRQKQLETNYEYWASFGFTYSFGSIYNSVVNTRFGI